MTNTRLWPQSHKAAQPAAAVALTDKSIAVLPFVDMSEKKDQEYFSDGLSGELIDMLTKIPKLRLPARTSSFYFKGKQATVAESPKRSAWHTCWKEAFANRAIICASPPSSSARTTAFTGSPKPGVLRVTRPVRDPSADRLRLYLQGGGEQDYVGDSHALDTRNGTTRPSELPCQRLLRNVGIAPRRLPYRPDGRFQHSC